MLRIIRLYSRSEHRTCIMPLKLNPKYLFRQHQFMKTVTGSHCFGPQFAETLGSGWFARVLDGGQLTAGLTNEMSICTKKTPLDERSWFRENVDTFDTDSKRFTPINAVGLVRQRHNRQSSASGEHGASLWSVLPGRKKSNFLKQMSEFHPRNRIWTTELL